MIMTKSGADSALIGMIGQQLSLASIHFPGKSVIEMIYEISDTVEPGRTHQHYSRSNKVLYKLTNRKIYELLVKYNEMREADRKNYESQINSSFNSKEA